MSRPTAARIMANLALTPENAKEAQIFRWLERYLKGSSHQMLAKLLRFSTASDVLLPDHSIAVHTEVMAPVAICPKAYTCFHRLILPRNFQSYSQMRNNLDLYLRDCNIWDGMVFPRTDFSRVWCLQNSLESKSQFQRHSPVKVDFFMKNAIIPFFYF